MDAQTRILKLLFEKKKMNYRDITDTGIHPNVARRELDQLIRKRLVKEEGRENWKRGKKLFYSLTEKGRTAYIHVAFDAVDKALRDVKEISDVILLDPKKLEEWRKMSNEAFYAIKITENMPLEERIKTFKTEHERIYGPLNESYKNLHAIICQLSFPPQLRNVPMFIGFTKKGGLYFIPNEFIKEKGLGFDLL
jgi:predicted ArsR family transcriptional regulator